MKQRLFSLLILTALALSLLVPPARAAGMTALTGQWENHRLSVRFDAPSDTTATLMAASYENGRMTQVKTAEQVRGGETVSFDGLKEAYLVRVFALDPKTSKPLCEQEEVRNLDAVDPDDYVVFHDTVPLPTADPEVTRALSSALSACVRAALALSEADRYLTETDADGRTRLELVSAASGPRLLPGGIGKGLPRRPDQNAGTIPTMAPVISLPVAHPMTAPSLEQVNAAMTSCEQMVRANAVLTAAAEREADALLSEVQAMEALSLQGGVSDEQLAWARSITEHYDAIESNKKLAQLARDMGCDAKRAYAQLVMAQNILKGQYAKEEGDLNELWEKRMIATKAGAKVGLFVCATIATGGATAASPAGFVSMGEAVGIVVGGVDATIEVSTAGTKLIFGPDSKVSRTLESKFKPLSDACFLYSLFTGGGDSIGEKLSFLGDLNERKNELYDNIKVRYNVDLGQMEASILTLNPLVAEAAIGLAADLLPDTDLGLEQPLRDMTAEEVLEDFSKGRPCDDAFLEDIISDLDLEVDLEEVTEAFEKEIDKELDEDFDRFYYVENDGFEHYRRTYDRTTGQLILESYYGGNRELMWEKRYDRTTGQLSSEYYYFDGPEGKRLVSVYTYYPAAEVQGTPEGGLQLYTFAVHEYPNFGEDYYGDLGDGRFGESCTFNPDGTLRSYRTAGCSESYEGNDELQSVSLQNEDGTITTYTYYTSATQAEPKGIGYRIFDETCRSYVQPAGHLREVKVLQPNPGSPFGPSTVYDFGYSVISWAVEGGIAYGYQYYESGVNSSGYSGRHSVYVVSTGD